MCSVHEQHVCCGYDKSLIALTAPQSRMSSTSNQETFRADLEGRITFDLLRQVRSLHGLSEHRLLPDAVNTFACKSIRFLLINQALPQQCIPSASRCWPQILTSSNLASFSLVDAVQTLLGRRLEVLPPSVIAQLAGLVPLAVPLSRNDSSAAVGASGDSARKPAKSKRGQSAAQGPDEEDAAAAALRLARYASTRVEMVMQLLGRLATIAETFELARATGLTLASVLYNAQMIRTWSLLLRRARAPSPLCSRWWRAHLHLHPIP